MRHGNTGMLTVLGLGLALALAACGGGDETPSPAGDGTVTPAAGGDPEGKIIFVAFRDGDQEIYVMDADGSDERNLTNDPGDDFDPDWSLDGTRIAYVSNRTGQAHVWVMDADGSNQQQLTQDSNGGLAPRWSNDGTKIVYTRSGSLYVMNADGSDAQVVMEAEQEKTAAPCRAGAFAGGWSPDDEVITYYSASVTRQIGQVCTIKAGGAEPVVIVADPESYDVEPVFSPDGKSIVYRAIIDGQHDIWVVDLDTGDKTNLTDDPDLDIEPDWSPDGEWISFGALRRGEPHFDLFIMRRDGTDVRRLTDDPAKEANPVWAP